MNQKYIYEQDLIDKLAKEGVRFKKGSSILDLGCGTGQYLLFLTKRYQCQGIGCDIKKDKNWERIKNKNLQFKLGSIFNLPFKNHQFDYIFIKDILHHIDEKRQSFARHRQGLLELKRVAKIGGQIIMVEANRANPIFYLHMTLLKGHNHFKRTYFKKLVTSCFKKVKFGAFESHVYPAKFLKLFKFWENILEKIRFFHTFLAYNLAIVINQESQNDKFEK